MNDKEINHHVSDNLLLAYSSGNLPEAFSIAVASHISMCDTCRSTMESFNAMGGLVLDKTIGVAINKDTFGKTLEKIAFGVPEVKRQLGSHNEIPTPLADYIGPNLDSIRWQNIGMGVKQSLLNTSSEATARLLYIPGGAEMPDHSHTGTELTLVLQGAFADEEDYFSRGDIEIADSGVKHTPVALDGIGCVCLTVTEAPLKFKKIFHKAIQPFLRI